ncbi:RNA dependent RNA polymerase-domain-containing protein [Phlebopus sp. FC_14]|nr:RNA dependent RNA polymerase-domain-containing protein [Phlebopus sp. FC_14]
MDKQNLSWGTVFEIARGVTKGFWDWTSITAELLEELRGTNTDAAHKVSAVIKKQPGNARSPAAYQLWAEYDREQAAILENKGRGLGGMGAWKGKDNWYGGRIQQVGRLVKTRGNVGFAIHLEKPEIRRSHRFSRFLGSRRVLQVRVSDDLLYKHGEPVRHLFSSHKFILCGRVYIPFHAKEGSIYMMETNENFQREPNTTDGDGFRLSLMDFVNWHNPLRANSTQPISKWSTRWALGLSTSVPTLEFEPDNIFFIIDECSDWGSGKAPAEKVLTDGCGLINGAALTKIMRIMEYTSRPTAIQGRIGGSKGMWLLHPDPHEQVADGPCKIWIRDSQTKIQLSDLHQLGPAQRLFDLLAPSRVTGPSHLSAQTLINLSHNGVPHLVLKNLMALGLEDELCQLTTWTGPTSMISVWKSVEHAGHVVISRLQRQLSGRARALGFGQLRPVDDQVGDDNEDVGESEITKPSTSADFNPYSGQPLTLHETALELLQAGFHPLNLSILFTKLESIIVMVLDDFVEKFHIPVAESIEAYIVPDPYGVLEEGEIHFRSSSMITDPVTGAQFDTVMGDVLVKAISHPKLNHYLDVIVFPIKGRQSLASYLGGGDTVMLTWCKELVDNFKGSPLTEPPGDLNQAFEREVEHVRDFDRRASDLSPKVAQQSFQKVLLLGLAETRVGLYSKFHDLAVYDLRGCPFTTCLDASKTGLRVKIPVFDRDQKIWGSRKPWYVVKLEKSKGKAGSTTGKLSVKRQSPPFILDELAEEGDRLRIKFLKDYKKLRNAQMDTEDSDLMQPLRSARSQATQAGRVGITGFSDNLADIEAHVLACFDEFQKAAAFARSSRSESSSNSFLKVAQKFSLQPAFRGFQFFSDDDVRSIKAALAVSKSVSFGFSMAFKELCAIKARNAGSVSFTRQFALCMSIPNAVIRTFSQARDSDD